MTILSKILTILIYALVCRTMGKSAKLSVYIKKCTFRKDSYMIQTILFDVDGTLIDTEQAIVHSLQETLANECKLEISDEEAKVALGIPGIDGLRAFSVPEDIIEAVLAKWSNHLNKLYDETSLFEGMEEVLPVLKDRGYRLGIVTSKPDDDMAENLVRFKLVEFFEVVITPSDTKKHKPNPEPILKALEILNEKPDNTLYIGDSIYDFRSAKSSGVQFGLAKWGKLEHEDFKKADFHFENPIDLIDHFTN